MSDNNEQALPESLTGAANIWLVILRDLVARETTYHAVELVEFLSDKQMYPEDYLEPMWEYAMGHWVDEQWSTIREIENTLFVVVRFGEIILRKSTPGSRPFGPPLRNKHVMRLALKFLVEKFGFQKFEGGPYQFYFAKEPVEMRPDEEILSDSRYDHLEQGVCPACFKTTRLYGTSGVCVRCH